MKQLIPRFACLVLALRMLGSLRMCVTSATSYTASLVSSASKPSTSLGKFSGYSFRAIVTSLPTLIGVRFRIDALRTDLDA